MNQTRKIRRRLGVVMEPVAGIKVVKDTTLGLLDAAQRRNWDIFCIESIDLYLRDGEGFAAGHDFTVSLTQSEWYRKAERREVALTSFDAILMRKDPPMDTEYFNACRILSFAEDAGVLVVNAPASLQTANEKLLMQRFSDLGPPTLVSANTKQLRSFLNEQSGIVMKPLDSMGGDSVFVLRQGDENTAALIEKMTLRGRRMIMAQQLIPEYRSGDKRVLLVDGVPVPGALLRVPATGEFRAALVVGGIAKSAMLDDGDREICARLAPVLGNMGVLFAGLDIIGGRLTEVNITSPGGMREINSAFGMDIGSTLFEAIEKRLPEGC